MSKLDEDKKLYQEGVRDGIAQAHAFEQRERIEKGQMHSANEPLLEGFTKYPTAQESYDVLKEEVRQLRDQWRNEELTEDTYRVYLMKLSTLVILKMWSWNYYSPESHIMDPESVDWFNEVLRVG